MIILTDDEDRENEGDLVIAATKCTPAAINFMATHARGLICLSLTEARLRQLNLPLMVQDNTSPYQTAFTVSIEAARGVTTGISAADRARTVLAAVAPNAKPGDLTRPGHIFPLRAREGGVLVRTGQTEGGVDLSRLAGLKPASVICEILKEDGTMARRDDLVEFARVHGLKIVTVADIIEYRLRNETMVQRIAEARLPTHFGDFRAFIYRNRVDSTEHLVLVMGTIEPDRPVRVRAHREYLPGDVFGYSPRNTRSLLQAAMERIAALGEGVILYLKRESDAIASDIDSSRASVAARRNWYLRASTHLSPPEADFRDYGIGAQILRDVGVRKMILLSDQAPRLANLPGYGLEIIGSEPLSDGDGVPGS
jgi:3,4-dihydroxy 2-butanone 4-phosphate synthase / GTP cyclohydrolase II